VAWCQVFSFTLTQIQEPTVHKFLLTVVGLHSYLFCNTQPRVFQSMTAPTFKTPEVANLYEEILPWCHEEYPFLDRNYSPASNMPAIDFTPQVATWLAEGREEAIAELWSYLTYSNDACSIALKSALRCQLPHWIKLSESARHELHAICILTLRAAMCSNLRNPSAVSSWLAATTLGSRHLDLAPDYDRGDWTAEMSRATKTVVLAPPYSGELLKAIESEMTENSFLGSIHGKQKGAKIALDTAMSEMGTSEMAAEKLKSIPPMARYVVYDCIYREWAVGTLRFDLYYEHRSYGCGREPNRQYIDWLGFFATPNDEADPPAAVTKQLLLAAFEQCGVKCRKSASRNEMVDLARTVPNLVSSLILQHCPEQRSVLPEWKESLNSWALRVRYVESVGAALLKILGVQLLHNQAAF
jgi:hypothetical protein